MIIRLARSAPEEVRGMFIALYDENRDVYERIKTFKQQADSLWEKYGDAGKRHCQDERAITTYLWLWYPNKYYIYKYSIVQKVAAILSADYSFKMGAYADNIRNFLRMYDEISAALKEDTELVDLFKANLTDSCYPDPELKTLTVDFCFYITNFYEERCTLKDNSSSKQTTNKENQNHEMTKTASQKFKCWLCCCLYKNMLVGEIKAFTMRDGGVHPLRFKNISEATVGDYVFCNNNGSIDAIGRISDIRECKDHFFHHPIVLIEKLVALSSPILMQDIEKIPDLSAMEYFSNNNIFDFMLYTLREKECALLLNLIREKNPTINFDFLEQSESNTNETQVETDSNHPTIPYTKDDFLSEVYMTEERYDALSGVLQNKLNIILQGAPGVGKTFAARRLAWSIMGEKDDSRIEFVQFHQNYSYEDFMMGYKPAGDSFELKYGIFYRFCQKAANQPDKPFFFIIDEINRGNMSKIFGELLMLIEKDYRGTKATLAYNGMQFSVPKNLYIIGMMNTADRSLAMIDYALRRRFSFFDIEPGFDSQGFLAYQNSLNNETLNALIAKVKDLNNEIALDKSLGKGFCIGHSYFCGRTNCTEEWLRAVVDYDILPMLREYWFDETNKLQRWENILQGVFQS